MSQTDATNPVEDLGAALGELARLVARVVEPSGADGPYEAHRHVGPAWALRASGPTELEHAVYTPMLCVVAQGAKQLVVGDESHLYDAGRFMLNSVALPAAGQVLVASPQEPCLWVMVELDPALVASVIVEAGSEAGGVGKGATAPQPAATASSIDGPLLDAVVRLARLFESPGDMGFLAPLALREIIYRLLQGGQAARLHQIASHGARAHRVVRAIEWLRNNFDKPLILEALARDSGMSLSSLHHHFKDVTAMSPLQFQKQMRLQEARRLMVSQGLDAASAGQRVGYQDSSYFSRDYRRFFGDPPRRHIARSQGEATPNATPNAA